MRSATTNRPMTDVAVASRLPSPRSRHWRNAVVLVGAGVFAVGLLQVTGRPGWQAVVVVALISSVVVGLRGHLRGLRGQLRDRCVEAVAPFVLVGGRKLDRRAVRLERWTAGWPGLPRRIVVGYAPAVPDTDPQWRTQVAATLSARLSSRYKVADHQPRRCLIVLRPDTGSEPPKTRRRIDRTISDLMGATARVTDVDTDTEGNPTRIGVAHEAGAKLAAAGYRYRVERTVSAVFPGRWRGNWDLENDTVVFGLRPTLPATIWARPITTADADPLETYDQVAIPVGVDEDGHEIVWRPAIDPNLMVVGAPGTGKALALNTLIPTPTGWTTMGALSDGDRVYDDQGKVCTVVTVHPVRTGRPCYQVEFTDGSQIVADADHLWATTTRETSDTEQVRSTAQVAATVHTATGHPNHRVRIAAPVTGETVLLPIRPYTLGAWLSHGDPHAPHITTGPEVIDQIRHDGYEVTAITRVELPESSPGSPQCSGPGMATYRIHGIGGHLAGMGLLTVDADQLDRCRFRHIPTRYLRASTGQRTAVLAGMMDTDGAADLCGTVSHIQTSFALAHDMRELACSLGFTATMSTWQPPRRPRTWTVGWTTSRDVFTVPRKLNGHRATRPATTWHDVGRGITAVTTVESVPVRCITVDSPSRLYLVGETFIPTHNTVAEHHVLVAVSQYGWPIWVVDGKSIEFLGWRGWPNVQIVATTIEEQVAVIDRAHQVMEHRYALIVDGRASEADFEPLMLFVDEFADFRANVIDWYSRVKRRGDPTKPPILNKLASIGRKGRSSRVHMLFATQRPDAEYFQGDQRDNFRMRISMGRLSPQGAMMMWQDPSVGVSVPRGCRGRGTAINDHNQAVETQMYRVPDPRKVGPSDTDELEVLDRLRPTEPRHHRLVILPPPPDLDGDDTEPSYHDVVDADWASVADRPDLDPVRDPSTIDHTRARELSSPMAIFGMSGAAPTGRLHIPSPTHPTTPRTDGTDQHGQDLAATDQADAEYGDGYGPSVDVAAGDLTVGDLVMVEDGVWAVVDTDPDDDPMDPDCMAVTWRDDTDGEGILSVPHDQPVRARRPDLGEEP